MGKFITAPELSLDLRPIFIPKTISQFLGEVARIYSVSEKILKIDDFVSRLETEIMKIDAFKRELPLCMLLMNDAIVALKEELMVFKKSAKQPVLEEFIPLNKTCDDDDDEEDRKAEIDNGDKKNWLSSTHLWNTNYNNLDTNQNHISKQNSVEQVIQKDAEKAQNEMINDPYCGKSERDYIPFKEEIRVNGLSLVTPGIKKMVTGNEFITKSGSYNKNDENNNNNLVPYAIPEVNSDIQISTSQPPQQQSSRKQRRCWSTELHKRFVNALQQLGGSKVATPKQIRELMRVDGLTNDEVKSHLQKYRLHTRRPPSGVGSGGLWAPPQDHYLEKQMKSQSGSPDGPLVNCTTTGGTSTTGGDSLDDGDDEKSENNCWKSHLHTSRKHNV